ncbi:hypothetical protein [Bradyrhizobium betae]|uniref:Uncharacterized protein n=1 Tax=Bradyrhizobium betae TaxID=244734 RepID=A0A4Q1ULU8_9BRAD|nr:hypothetical protein [Bradyrhizobium betae]RXT36536.1 hypothetical protein B5V03_33350 [Bradyrhizobium betae]
MLAAVTSPPALPPLQAFANRTLRAFAGLASPTSLDDVGAVFDLDRSWHGQGFLGSAGRRTDWFSAAAKGFARGIRVWGEDEAVVLVEATDVSLPEPLTSLLNTLGEPEAKLDSFLGTFEIKGSEYVYARRGLVLYVNPATAKLLRIAGFAPASLYDYQRNLRLDLEVKLLPPSRDDMP